MGVISTLKRKIWSLLRSVRKIPIYSSLSFTFVSVSSRHPMLLDNFNCLPSGRYFNFFFSAHAHSFLNNEDITVRIITRFGWCPLNTPLFSPLSPKQSSVQILWKMPKKKSVLFVGNSPWKKFCQIARANWWTGKKDK